jgi:ATP-dependent HslUV protease subunit HslV
MLNKFAGNLMRSAVELADLWRSDKIGRKLDAMMITADANTLLIISGTGEVIEPDGGICAIGSGGNYALAAARALSAETDYDAETIARKSLKIASEICVYTNDHIRCETVGSPLLPSNEEKCSETASETPVKKTRANRSKAGKETSDTEKEDK